MEYTIHTLSGDEYPETVEGHVLARAYRAAWRARHGGDDPTGQHVIPDLDLIIEYSTVQASCLLH